MRKSRIFARIAITLMAVAILGFVAIVVTAVGNITAQTPGDPVILPLLPVVFIALFGAIFADIASKDWEYLEILRGRLKGPTNNHEEAG